VLYCVVLVGGQRNKEIVSERENCAFVKERIIGGEIDVVHIKVVDFVRG
jgi:hypothetical protein